MVSQKLIKLFLYCSLYREELEHQQVNDIEKVMSKQFAAWFEKHVRATKEPLTERFMIEYIFNVTNSLFFATCRSPD